MKLIYIILLTFCKEIYYCFIIYLLRMICSQSIIFLSLLTIFLISYQTNSWCLTTILQQNPQIVEVAWAPDNSIFVTANRGQNAVKIYDAKTYQLLKVHNNSGQIPNSVKISRNSLYIGIGYDNGWINVLSNSGSFPSLFSLNTSHGSVAQVDFTYDNSQIFTCGSDKRYKSFSITGSNALNINNMPSPVGVATACRIGQFGHRAMADQSNRTRAFYTNDSVYFNHNYTDAVTQIDYLPGSDQFATVSKDKYFRVNGSPIFNDSDQLLSVSVGRLGQYYAIGGKTKILRIYNVSASSFMAKFNIRGEINSVRISSDQKTIIVGDNTGQIKIFRSICPFYCESGQYNASGICKKCYLAIPNCLKCQLPTTCQYCMAGYYGNGGSSCLPCYTTLDYCLQCKDSLTCLHCLDGYYLDSGNKCKPCSDTLRACTQCDDSNTCTQCIHLQFYLDGNDKCQPCANAMANCLKCYDSSSCVQCQIGFYENGNNNPRCKECPNNCLVCQSSSNCSQCKVGYWANSGSCVRCTDNNCISCNSSGICFDCQQGTYLTMSNTCVDCNNPCATCNVTANNCTSCVLGFYFDSLQNLCFRCNTQNCKVCNQTSKCLSCFPGFKLDSTTNTCKACSNFYPNCSQCTSAKCIKCFQAFYVDTGAGNVCKTCISNIPKCIKCFNSTNCIDCAIGYYNTLLTGSNACAACAPGCSQCISYSNCTNCFQTYFKNSSNVCQPCKNNCLECTSQINCMNCVIGFYLDLSTCKACKNAIQFCAECVDSSICLTCAIGTYLDTDSKCKLCPLNCTTCNKDDCFSCEVGYYVSSTTPKKCIKCPLYCQQCTSSLVCSSCIDGYYFDSSDNQCKGCNTLFSDCTLCNKTHCLECNRGRQLNKSSSNFKCQLCSKHISNCKICYWDNIPTPAVVKCSLCKYGYGSAPSLLSCSQCNDITGCIECITSTKCTKCQIGYYLKNDSTCGLCSSKCQTCNNSLTCLTCIRGYAFDTSTNSCILCETKIEGCSQCIQNGLNTFQCNYCQIGYYLQSLTKKCILCIEKITGCYTCNSSAICTSCLDRYYLNSNTSKCQRCSYPSAMMGCDLCNSSSVCIKCSNMYYLQSSDKKCYFCSNNISGCLYCKNKTTCSQCNSGYYLTAGNVCNLCQSQIQGCNYCTNTSFCSLCRSGYYLSATDNKCHKCNQTGCQFCSQNQANQCVTCNSKYYLSGTTCIPCRNRVTFCQTCTTTDCTHCEVGYFRNNSTSCVRCSLIMQGCSRCIDSTTCLQCKSSYFLNSSNLCQECNSIILGCQNCLNQTLCLSCSTNYFLNSSTQLCQSCTDIQGCLLCKDQNTCALCQQKYFLNSTTYQCELCNSYIPACFSCATSSICIQCQSGYVLQTISYKCVINLVEAKQKVETLKMVSYYVSNQVLKHILYVKGMNFVKIDPSILNITLNGKTKLFIQDFTGKQIQLNILSYQYSNTNSYSIIFYTDNPISGKIQKTKGDLSFRRLLLVNQELVQVNLQVLLKMDQSIYQQILPELDYDGSMTVGYSLNNPQFIQSYMKSQQNKYLKYQIFGIVLICLFIINYIIKYFFTLPTSKNQSNIIPHIIAVKACNLIIYPAHFQLIYFCYGFMFVDMPWINASFSQYLTNKSDFVQLPFGLFFDNMNVAATFLFGLLMYLCIYLLIQLYYYINSQKKAQKANKKIQKQSDMDSQLEQKKNRQPMKKIQQSLGITYQNQSYQKNLFLVSKKNSFHLLWNLIIFSVVYYSCLGVQGAFYNPLSFVSLYGVFYIGSVFLFIFVSVQTIYSCIRNLKSFYKLRIYLKACFLCLGHLNPVYIVTVGIILDMSLAVIQFYVIYKKNMFTKALIFNHMIPNICIGLLIFGPNSLASLLISAILLFLSLLTQIFLHYLEYKQSKNKITKDYQFNIQQNQSKISQNSSINQQNNHRQNLKDLQRTDFQFFSLDKQKMFKDMDMFATAEQFGFQNNNHQEDMKQQIQQMVQELQRQKRMTNSSEFSYKKGQRRSRLKKTHDAFNKNSMQIVFQGTEY